MKKQLYGLLAAGMITGFSAVAQETTKTKEKSEKKEVNVTTNTKDGKKEIVIEKRIKNGKDSKDEKMVIVVDGDQVTINGKPAKDFKGQHFFNDDDFDGDFNIHISPEIMGQGRDMVRNFSRTRSNKAMLGVSTEKDEKGAKVKNVVDESAADKAGLKEGDVIVSVNSDKLSGDNDLIKVIGKYKPEDAVDITVLRDGKEKKLKAVLGKNDSPTAMNWNWNGDDHFVMPPMARIAPTPGARSFNFEKGDWPNIVMGGSEKPKFGFSIEDNADGNGVKITDIKDESNAAKAGLKKDDLITELNGKAIKNTDELKQELNEQRDKTDISLKVLRNGNSQTISVRVPKKIKTADL